MDTTLDVTAASGKSHTRARSTWEAHEPDGISIALWYDLFDVGGGRNASVEDVRLRLVCLPDRVVLTTTGMAALERNDTDSQTPNDVGGCLGHENGNLSASLLRLIPQLEAPFWNTLVRSAFTPDAPNRSATSASYDGDRIRANYEVTVGTTTVPLDSVVVGGRIVSDHLVGSGRGLSYESSVSYTYGPRPQPPADVGTHLV